MLEPLETRLCLSVSLSPVFGNHMVLQRDMPIHVEGSALPGENVAVTLAGPTVTETASTQTNSAGAWSIALGALPAGGPYTLTAAGQNTVVLSDLLMGDVWVCAGQSNMAMPLNTTDNGAAVVSQANQPQLRLYSQNTGWADTTPASAANFSAVAYYFGAAIQQDQGVPIGLELAAADGTSIRLWNSWQSDVTTPALAPFLDVVASDAGGGSIPGAPPGYLYNTLIQPLTTLAVKGVIWYQGEFEAETQRADEYAVLFPALIASWRQAWNQGNFPFLYVQMSPYPYGGLTAIQQVQLDTLSEVPNTAMAVIVDGQSNILHPTDKQLPGDRLALAAEALAYGQNVIYSGPVCDGWSLNGNQAVLDFQDIGSGLVFSDGASSSFEVENAAGQWVAANAAIQNGTIVVWNNAVATPLAVRYAYEANPDYDLFNANGLPASPFEVTAADQGPLVVPRQTQYVLQGTAGAVRLGSFTPPPGIVGPWSAQIAWGDGASTTLQYATLPDGGALGTATHIYNAVGNYAVHVTIRDGNGDVLGQNILAVSVLSPAPLLVDANGDLFTDFPGEGVWELPQGAALWRPLTAAGVEDASLLVVDGAGELFAQFPGYGVWRLPQGTAGWQQMTAAGVADASLLAADGGGNLFADFPGEGVWEMPQGATVWRRLTAAGVEDASLLTVTGDGRLFADFPGEGVQEYVSGTYWQVVRPAGVAGDATLLTTDGAGDQFADFPGQGVWRLPQGATAWQQLTAAGVEDALLLTADGNGDLFADFPGYGVWGLPEGTTAWRQLTASGVVRASLLAADAGGDLFVAFPGYGVWRLSEAATVGQWQQLPTPGGEAAVLLKADAGGDLFADFQGAGVWALAQGTAVWRPLTAPGVESASLLAADNGGDLFADFPGYGVWGSPQGTTAWQRLTAPGVGDASLLAADGNGDLFADFPGYGVWRLSKGGTVWQWRQLTAPGVEDASLLAADGNGDLFADFRGYGVDEYAPGASWQSVHSTGAEDAILLAVDGAGDLFADFRGEGVWVLPKGATVWRQLTTPGEDASLFAADGNGDLFAEFANYGVEEYLATTTWQLVGSPATLPR